MNGLAVHRAATITGDDAPTTRTSHKNAVGVGLSKRDKNQLELWLEVWSLWKSVRFRSKTFLVFRNVFDDIRQPISRNIAESGLYLTNVWDSLSHILKSFSISPIIRHVNDFGVTTDRLSDQ